MKEGYLKNPLFSSKSYAVIFAGIIAVLIVIFAGMLVNSRTSILGLAFETDGFRFGCYYKMSCPPRNKGSQSVFSCSPVLICPTPTVYPKPTLTKTILTCSDCAANRLMNLCFDTANRASYCTSSYPGEISNTSCVSCRLTPTPYSTIYPRPSCIPLPTTCPPGSVCPAFLIYNSGDYWCLPTPPPITPQPSCYPPPPCLFSEPRCLMPEPIGGWCQITPTPSLQCQGKPDGFRCYAGCENIPTCQPGGPCYACDRLPGICKNQQCMSN